ncbi:MAG: hypothetical protein ACTHLL_02435, partial [Candidatus Nitrosocosmicus sp.]
NLWHLSRLCLALGKYFEINNGIEESPSVVKYFTLSRSSCLEKKFLTHFSNPSPSIDLEERRCSP